MKRKIVAMVLIMLAGCSSGPARRDAESAADVSAVTGWVNKSIFLTDPGHAAFRACYDSAHVDRDLAGMIRSLSAGVEVLVFYGPWCSDSRVQVPVFMRIAESAGIADERIRYYALDRSKTSPDGLTERYAIELVPTFVFLRGGKEIGRVVESPRTTLEGDIVALLVAAGQKGEL